MNTSKSATMTVSTRTRIIAAASVVAVAGIATTFAAFTDSGAVSTELASGSLDLKFDADQDGTATPYAVPFSTGADNLAPGDQVRMNLEIFNSGTVDAQLDLMSVDISNSVGAPATALEDVVEISVSDGATTLYTGALSALSFEDLGIGSGGSQGGGTNLTFTATLPAAASTAVAGQELDITMNFTADQA